MRLLKYASKEWRKICRRFNRRRIVDKIKCFFVIKRPPTFSEFVGFELQRENDDRAEALTNCREITREEHEKLSSEGKAVVKQVKCADNQEIVTEYFEDLSDTEKPTYSITIDFTALINALQQMTETFVKFAADFAALMSNISDFQELNAWVWAEKYHPEWCAIYNRTKKRRIKKKYKDRVMRAYAAFNESEE